MVTGPFSSYWDERDENDENEDDFEEDHYISKAVLEDVAIEVNSKDTGEVINGLVKIRNNLYELSTGAGAMTLCFRDPKTDEVDKQICLAGDSIDIFVSDGSDGFSPGNLIVPDVEGLIQGSAENVGYIYCG